MIKASNCVQNLKGMDRDVAVSLRKEIQKHAQESLIGNVLPTAEDLDNFLDRFSEEERIRSATSAKI